jgi:hypothetical protein
MDYDSLELDYKKLDFATLQEESSVPFVLFARVLDRDGAQLGEFEIPCGGGEQTARWLGMVVSQRLARDGNHNGNRHTHRRGKIPTTFQTPSAVFDELGVPLEPTQRLNGAFRNGDIARITMSSVFGANMKPIQRVNELGNPVTTSFQHTAFQNSESMRKARSNPAMSTRFDQHVPGLEDASGSRRRGRPGASITNGQRKNSFVAEEKIHRVEYKDAEDRRMEARAADFRADMQQQMIYRNTFGLMDAEEHRFEVLTVLEHEFKKMKLSSIEPLEEEQGRMREVFADFFADLNAMFKHYCAFSELGSSASMSFAEFCRLLHHCRLFDEFAARNVLRAIFEKCNYETVPDADNPDLEFLRFEFFEALMRLACLEHKKNEVTTSQALRMFLDRMQVGRIVLNVP